MTENWKLPLYKIFTDDEDITLISKIIKRGRNWAIGPEIEEFEDALSNYLGSDYCLALNSGTSALHAAFLAYGLGVDDEVLVPSFSFISTANAVLFTNSRPVFVDIENDTLGMDPQKIEQMVTSKTKAIVPMDYGGLSCKIFEIQKIANEINLPLIEDAAECLGATVNGKKVGTVSDTAIFSFCGNKVITTGEGGAITTNSKDIYEKIKLIRSHGRVDDKLYFDNPEISNYVQVGYNWRMSSITAALGIAQLNKLDKIIKMRQERAELLSKKLSKITDIAVPKTESKENIFQMYSIILKDNAQRNNLHKFLIEKQIFSKIYFEPIHLMKFYKEKFDYSEGMLPVTEDTSQRILTLPMYPNMTNEEMEYLVSSMYEFFENIS